MGRLCFRPSACIHGWFGDGMEWRWSFVFWACEGGAWALYCICVLLGGRVGTALHCTAGRYGRFCWFVAAFRNLPVYVFMLGRSMTYPSPSPISVPPYRSLPVYVFMYAR